MTETGGLVRSEAFGSGRNAEWSYILHNSETGTA